MLSSLFKAHLRPAVIGVSSRNMPRTGRKSSEASDLSCVVLEQIQQITASPDVIDLLTDGIRRAGWAGR